MKRSFYLVKNYFSGVIFEEKAHALSKIIDFAYFWKKI